MKSRYKIVLLTVSALSLLATKAVSANANISMGVKEFSVKTKQSRLFIDNESRGAILSIENVHEYPILVQTKVINQDQKTGSNAFFATPPLFRLDSGQNSKVRIYKKDINDLPKDREFLFWVCVKGIPPTDTDIWAKEHNDSKSENKTTLGVNIALENCIKLIHRPKDISPVRYDDGGEIVWSLKNGKLSGFNPTPNILTIRSLVVNNKRIDPPGFIQPFSEKLYDINIEKNSNISWNIITDLGGDGRLHNGKVI
ncbi:fimbria/pilus periplasmic chaperone [Escherichia coli]|nr:fimbria/pilus periplasmic chaperone [Escherichia coli]EIZ3415875.1 fimbria/pilus periplasmic chaperone [Escherichia coli]